jgi:pimeloyl-ACP methyl ester carboxylesterase
MRIIITFLAFFVFVSFCNAQQFDIGEINGAKYRIYIPENWNKGLVIYCHGYEEIGEEIDPLTAELDDFVKIFSDKGFAFAESSYRKQGLIIKEGIEDTEALRQYFENTYEKTELNVIVGHSMGGMITLATIEKFHHLYEGALPLCGWLSPASSLIKRGLDMLAIYDYLFEDNNSGIINQLKYIDEEDIDKNLKKNLALAESFSKKFKIKRSDLAEMLSFQQIVLHESMRWLNGLPSGNEQTIYDGFGELNDEINKNILRYKPNFSAQEYYINNYTPTGVIYDPVLAIHNLYDALLPIYNYEYYNELTKIRSTNELYKQVYVSTEGHCEFSIKEISDYFNELINWVRTNKKKI